jgi:hypothetical protein
MIASSVADSGRIFFAKSRPHISGLMLFGMCGLSAFALAARAEDRRTDGDARIRSPAGAQPIVITTTPRLAGAIHSLTWNGREFIDSHDHGRQLQSAINCDAGSPIAAETFNPTEAGSRDDGAGGTSTSRLLHLVARENSLQTTTQMAFWLAPGEESEGQPAKNTTRLSNHLLTKRVTIGTDGFPQMLRYDLTFSLPVGEVHQHVVFEALTGYMPREFEEFWRFDRMTQRLVPLTDGPGELSDPVVLATPDGAFAMGIIAQPSPVSAMRGPTYGRFRFPREKVVKWNCVYRLIQAEPIPPGEYSFSLRVPIGTRDEVQAMLREWLALSAKTPGDEAPVPR